MLSANYTNFRHIIKNITIIRTLSFILPNYLSDHVVTITPTTIFPHLSLFIDPISSNTFELNRQKRHENVCSCQYYTRPCYLRNRYDIHQYHALPSTNITLSIIGLMGQYINDNDTDSFLTLVDQNNDRSKPKINILGYDNQLKPGREASLDVQYALAIARGVKVTFWSISNLNDPFSDFLFQLADMKYPPDMISISYGFLETINDYTLFQKAINQELQKAAARGVTIIAATGDNGVGEGKYKEKYRD
jgi:tripeptidyl-peptidase-1